MRYPARYLTWTKTTWPNCQPWS